MSDRKRERELQDEIVKLGEQLETTKKYKQELEKQLKDCKRQTQPNIPLSTVKSKEEAASLLRTYGNEEIKMSESGQSLQEIIDDKIEDNEKIQDCQCAIYYNIGSNYHLKVIPYDKKGKWEKTCDEYDAKKDWVQIYAK